MPTYGFDESQNTQPMYNHRLATDVSNQGKVNPNGTPISNLANPPPATTGANGRQAYRATQAPTGMDQTTPGYGEQYWQNNQNLWQQSPQLDWASQQLPKYDTPGFGEQYNTEGVKAFGQPGQGSQFWNQIQGQFNQQHGGNLQPQFDAFYDRGENKAVGAANQQANARGAYGSSAALNNVGNVIDDWEANRAKAGTDFALANSKNMQDMATTYGNLAFGAGNEDLKRQGMGSDIAFHIGDQAQNRTNQGINNAMGIDQSYLNRTNSGFNAANTAQGAFEGRAQHMFDNTRAMSQDALQWAMQNYDKLSASDRATVDAQINAGLGKATQDQNADQTAADRVDKSVAEGVSAVNGARK